MTQRIYQIDYIKAFAIVSVVTVHFLLNSGFYDIKIGSWISSADVVLRIIFITAIPIFIMTTGFLMGNKKLSSSYIVKLFHVLEIYVAVSLIDWVGQAILLGKQLSLTDALYGLLDFSTDSYSWYVEMYIGLYLIIPLLNAAWHFQKDDQYHIYIVSITFILFFLPSLFNTFGKIIPDWWVSGYPIGYYYVGMYFKEHLEDIKQISLKVLSCYALVVFGTIAIIELNNNTGKVFEWTNENDYMGYQPFVIAVLLFLLMLRLPVKRPDRKRYRIFAAISSMTLSIYLFSDLTDSIIYHYFKQTIHSIESRLYFGPIIVFLSFTMAVLCAFILQRLLEILAKDKVKQVNS